MTSHSFPGKEPAREGRGLSKPGAIPIQFSGRAASISLFGEERRNWDRGSATFVEFLGSGAGEYESAPLRGVDFSPFDALGVVEGDKLLEAGRGAQGENSVPFARCAGMIPA